MHVCTIMHVGVCKLVCVCVYVCVYVCVCIRSECVRVLCVCVCTFVTTRRSPRAYRCHSLSSTSTYISTGRKYVLSNEERLISNRN